MFKINGKYNSATIYSNFVEPEAQSQIINLLNTKTFEDCNIKIMPDVHAGTGCVIGFTSTIKDKIIPNLVGVDIGCGVLSINIGQIKNINFEELDNYIRNNIPSGFSINNNISKFLCLEKSFEIDLNYIANLIEEDYSKLIRTLSSLGGGNHFIELNLNSKNEVIICVHSGSRNPGLKVAQYYQKIAKEHCKKYNISVSNGLEYLEGKEMKNYLKAMKIMQEFAHINRTSIIINLLKYFKNSLILEEIESIHNYIDIDKMIIRKGAISAEKNQKLIIPINMRDGSIIGIGKGNKDWNYSAPHGAGRLMSRGNAKRTIELKDFENSMKGIWSSCIDKERLDESPFAYKSINEIKEAISDTVEITDIIKPIYNFKG